MITKQKRFFEEYSDTLLNYDSIQFLACNDISGHLHELNLFDINVTAIDYDPKFINRSFYLNKDFVFDDVDLDAELVVHFNCEKTAPFINYSGDIILIGDNQEHNGDCRPVYSAQDLIDWYNVKEVYESKEIIDENYTHYLVYGRV